MFNSTVNELSKYVLADHHDGDINITTKDLITYSKGTFHEDQPIEEASKFLIKENLTGLPVVNTSDQLVGFLSEKDCLKNIFDNSINKMPPGNVGDYMTTSVINFTPDTSIYKILEFFISKPYHLYPVVENGKYIGFVSRKSVLKALMKNKL